MKNLIFIFSSILFGLYSCSDSHHSNKLHSTIYNSEKERVEILKNEINSFSDFTNAEFRLFNVNGFSNSRTSIPGASSLDYKFVIKVNPSDIDKWTKGMIKTPSFDHSDKWMKKIVGERKNEWKTESVPEFYICKGENV